MNHLYVVSAIARSKKSSACPIIAARLPSAIDARAEVRDFAMVERIESKLRRATGVHYRRGEAWRLLQSAERRGGGLGHRTGRGDQMALPVICIAPSGFARPCEADSPMGKPEIRARGRFLPPAP
jgi:hypothetical protein